jgi:hypothetical protein
VSSIEPYRI